MLPPRIVTHRLIIILFKQQNCTSHRCDERPNKTVMNAHDIHMCQAQSKYNEKSDKFSEYNQFRCRPKGIKGHQHRLYRHTITSAHSCTGAMATEKRKVRIKNKIKKNKNITLNHRLHACLWLMLL